MNFTSADTEGLALDISDPKWDDVNLFTSCLKMYFQELPEPLFTYQMYTQFVDVISKFFTSEAMSFSESFNCMVI